MKENTSKVPEGNAIEIMYSFSIRILKIMDQL